MKSFALLTETSDKVNGITPLQFGTTVLNENQLKDYLIELCNVYGGNFSFKMLSGLKRFRRIDESEYAEFNSIKPLIDEFPSLSTVDDIAVGDMLSVLALEIIFAYKEIMIISDSAPKEITKIKQNVDGTIKYVKFADGTRYPKVTPATYAGKPLVYAMYFNATRELDAAMTFINLKLPQDWEIIEETQGDTE